MNTKVLSCNMCGVELKPENVCKAHLFPEWCVREQKSQTGDSTLYVVGSKFDKTRRPTGSYDKEILCRNCDRKIGYYDGVAKKVLISTRPTRVRIPEGRYIKLAGVVPRDLHIFILSLLWRFHISDRVDSGNINLGPYAEIFLKAIKDQDPKSLDLLPVTLYQQSSTDTAIQKITRGSTSVTGMIREKGRPSYYEVVLPRGFTFHVKTDKRDWSFPDLYDLMEGTSLLVYVKEAEETLVFQGMKNLIKAKK